MPKIDLTDWTPDAGHHRTTGEDIGPSNYKLLAQLGGLTQFGAHLERLEAGSRSSPQHRHENEDELVFVLDGEVVLMEDDAETVLTAGDAAAWPAGHHAHHCLDNRSAHQATYLVVGTKAQSDRVHFYDHDLILDWQRTGKTVKRTLTKRDGTPA